MRQIAPNVFSWASQLELEAEKQAITTSRLNCLSGHVALMPDAHFGLGATVGSVIPTQRVLIPAAVGVDIGCGMIAAQVDFKASHLPDNLDPLIDTLTVAIPAGVGQGHVEPTPQAQAWYQDHENLTLTVEMREKALAQFGTLGSGNHFFEICLDEHDTVWVMLHSGSRGVGNKLAQQHIKEAQGLMKEFFIELEDPDLACADNYR